jgi:hypothetical protein
MRGTAAAHESLMTMQSTNTITYLDGFFDPELVTVLDEMPEQELWWEAEHTNNRMPCWSVAFALDLLGCVDAAADFPFAVLGHVESNRWMQVFAASGIGYSVELSALDGNDTNTMAILGRPGGGGKQVQIVGGHSSVTVRASQVLTLEDARIAFSSWILEGVYPAPYDAEYRTY